MLSEELSNVAAHLRAKKILTPSQTRLLAVIVDGLADDARAYEDTPIVVEHPRPHHGTLPAGVVDLRGWKRRARR